MEILIGKLTYPQSATDAEILKSELYCGETENKLVFSIINRSEVAVTAFHADVVYFDNDEEKKASVEERDYYLESNGISKEFTVTLPKGVEEGRIVLPVVLYDDLTASKTYISVPFASQEVVEKFASDYLSGLISTVQRSRKTQSVAVKTPVKTVNAEKTVNENVAPKEQIKNAKVKRIISLVCMCVTLLFTFISIPVGNRIVANMWMEYVLYGGEYPTVSVIIVIFALIAITCAFVSTLERTGFTQYRWVITTVNSVAGAFSFVILLYFVIGVGTIGFDNYLLLFVYPVIPAILARVINKDAVPTVLLVTAFGAIWLIPILSTAPNLYYGDAMGMIMFLSGLIQVSVLLVTGIFVQERNKPRLKSAKVFAILTTVFLSLFYVAFWLFT